MAEDRDVLSDRGERPSIADAYKQPTEIECERLREELERERRARGLEQLDIVRFESEIDRLRQQNHDHAAARDAEMASLRSRVDCYENAYRAARERLEGLRPTWTDAEGAQKPGGWWNYTSLNHRDEAVALFLEVERHARLIDAAQVVWSWVGPGYPDLDDGDERQRFMASVSKVAMAWFVLQRETALPSDEAEAAQSVEQGMAAEPCPCTRFACARCDSLPVRETDASKEIDHG